MKTPPLFESVEDLVLHRPPLLLLQSVSHWDVGHVEAIADPVDSYLFADGEGKVPAWVGLEYMAQAISAYAGIIARQNGEEPSIGFLLGTRRYDTHVDSFTPGQQLRVNVREVFRDENNLVLFDCDIHAGEDLLASAQVKAIQPKGTIQVKPDESVKES